MPAADRAEFDDLLTEARFAMNLRDDNGPTTAEWRLGLLRRAMLETGRPAGRERPHRGGRPTRSRWRPDEVAAAAPRLGDADGRRAGGPRRTRAPHLSTLTPPATLGRPEPEPPLSAMPPATAELLLTVRTVMDLLATQHRADGLPGTGVGAQVARGRVRTARSPEEAISTLEPGEVLVVPFTTPAYNVVLPLCRRPRDDRGRAAVHAAVLARELGLAAVVGASGALLELHDGMEVEVDPVAGEVRLVSVATG